MLTEKIFNAIDEENRATVKEIVNKHLYPKYETNQISTILKRLYDRGLVDREDVSNWKKQKRYEYWLTEKGKKVSNYKEDNILARLRKDVLDYFIDKEGKVFD